MNNITFTVSVSINTYLRMQHSSPKCSIGENIRSTNTQECDIILCYPGTDQFHQQLFRHPAFAALPTRLLRQYVSHRESTGRMLIGLQSVQLVLPVDVILSFVEEHHVRVGGVHSQRSQS